MTSPSIPYKLVLTCMTVSAIVLFFFSGATSPLYNIAYSDGLVFRYVALGIAEGKIPYVDVFDNKGPLLYFINYMGLLIDEDYGLLFLQWLHLSFFIFLCYRLHQLLHAHSFYSWLLPLLLTFLIRFFDNGNMTEEWSLSLLTLPLFFILPLYQEEKRDLRPSQSFFYGLCIGLLAMLRLNNAVPLLAILLWWLIGLIRSARYVSLAHFLVFASLGFLLPVTLAAGWFYQKAGLYGCYEWIYATIIVNFVVFKSVLLPSIPLWKIVPVFFFHVTFVCLCLLKTCNLKQKPLVIPLVLTFVLSCLSMGHSWFGHYQMVLVPTFLISIGLFAQSRKHLILSVFLLTSLYLCKYSVSLEWWHYQEKARQEAFQKDFALVIGTIPSDQRRQLWNLNVHVWNYIDVAYQQKIFPVNRFDRPILADDKYPQPTFMFQHPAWVLVDEDDLDKESVEAQFLYQHYQSVARTSSPHRHCFSLYRRTI